MACCGRQSVFDVVTLMVTLIWWHQVHCSAHGEFIVFFLPFFSPKKWVLWSTRGLVHYGTWQTRNDGPQVNPNHLLPGMPSRVASDSASQKPCLWFSH